MRGICKAGIIIIFLVWPNAIAILNWLSGGAMRRSWVGLAISSCVFSVSVRQSNWKRDCSGGCFLFTVFPCWEFFGPSAEESASLTARMFPDWDAHFHLVDNVLAGFEGFAAVGGGDFDPEGGLVDGDDADAVDEADGFDRPPGGDFGEDMVELAAGHRLEGFVVDGGNLLLTFGCAHNALKRDDGADVHGNFSARRERGFVDFGSGDFEFDLHQPPCTGGKSETWSPSLRMWFGDAYSRPTAMRVERAAGASLGKRS